MLAFRGNVQFYSHLESRESYGNRTTFRFLVVRARHNDAVIPITGRPFDGYVVSCTTYKDLRSKLQQGMILELSGEVRGSASSRMKTAKSWYHDLCVEDRGIRVIGNGAIALNIAEHISTYGSSRYGDVSGK